MITVSNTGNAPLTVTSITSTNPQFSLVSPRGSFIVAVGGQQPVTARFRPTAASEQRGMLNIVSNDPLDIF
jgi:hypothetical protein